MIKTHKRKNIRPYEANLPDGTDKDEVTFWGYVITRNGRVMSKKTDMELEPNQEGSVYLHTTEHILRIKLTDLLDIIFNGKEKDVDFPDGTTKNYVEFQGLSIYPDGTIYGRNGKEVGSNVLRLMVIDDRGNEKLLSRARIIYNIFSGDYVEPGRHVYHKDGNVYNNNISNLSTDAKYAPKKKELKKKLSEAQVEEIKKLYESPDESYTTLAGRYMVSRDTIKRIIHGVY